MPFDNGQLSTLEPNDLVQRARGGCADSFNELARRFRPRLLNLLRSKIGAVHPDGEDLAQETLLRAFQQLDRFDSRYQFSTWIYTIAVRLAYDHARTRLRLPRHVSLDDSECLAKETIASEQSEHQNHVDNLWMIARRILSDAQYTAMWLRYAEELSTTEIAKVLGKTSIGVRVLLHRSRSLLIAETARMESAQQKKRTQTAGKD